ncbi:MAG: glycosyltransferase [Candidatus Methylarchaceae archaeon HK01M]|nr:glycosyltransferase [Candidatus Methylarchaceae archaeon HK01M]
MKSKPKVFLTGGDSRSWTLDDDLNLIRNALERKVEFTDLDHCEVVHSVWWEELLSIPKEKLVGKRIICHIPTEPAYYLTLPRHRLVMPMVGCWITRSNEANQQLISINISNKLIPYTIDIHTFQPLHVDDAQIQALRTRWDIPDNSYLIGNFQSNMIGSDLVSPSLVKGLGIFAEIVRGVQRKGPDIHVVIAGPRRHWLRRKLDDLGIPFTFIGQAIEEDDMRENMLSREILNLLYNLIDLYLVTSRSEGDLQSIMEAASARCKIISLSMGLANDILDSACVYTSPVDAIEFIERDIRENWIETKIENHYKRVHKRFNLESVAPLFQELYDNYQKIRQYMGDADSIKKLKKKSLQSARRMDSKYRFKLLDRIRNKNILTILYKFHKSPWGGANQFLSALRKEFLKRGWKVSEKLSSKSKLCIFDSFKLDMDIFRDSTKDYKNTLMIHRVDGPTIFVRGNDKELDDVVFEINNKVADITIFQSFWSYRKTIELGYEPINPIIIPNAVDQSIFNRRGRVKFSNKRKINIISTSWSSNPRKGFEVYKWLDNNLDWEKYEYKFIGRTPKDIKFNNIQHLEPMPSEELALKLKESDIYIIASQCDPCSNALIEALACGLPSIYLNDGGHPELVKYAGFGFYMKEEISNLLNHLVMNYEFFQNLISIPTMDEIASKYLSLLNLVHHRR